MQPSAMVSFCTNQITQVLLCSDSDLSLFIVLMLTLHAIVFNTGSLLQAYAKISCENLYHKSSICVLTNNAKYNLTVISL